jgi:Bacterial extracellular solute-binding proteins, family 5 Middle
MDWVETPLPDLLSRLRQSRDIVVDVCDPHGNYPLLRPNHVSGPTANVGVRRAIMAALDPAEIIHAVTGGEPGTSTAPVGCFLPGSASDSRNGMERLGPKDPAVIKAMLREAGYANERLVLLHASDFAPVHTMWQVIAARLAEAGFNVDDQVMDQATVVTRRNNREAPDKGGWSLLIANAPAADHLSPMVALGLRAGAAAWAGRPIQRSRRCGSSGSIAPIPRSKSDWPLIFRDSPSPMCYTPRSAITSRNRRGDRTCPVSSRHRHRSSGISRSLSDRRVQTIHASVAPLLVYSSLCCLS